MSERGDQAKQVALIIFEAFKAAKKAQIDTLGFDIGVINAGIVQFAVSLLLVELDFLGKNDPKARAQGEQYLVNLITKRDSANAS